MTRASDDALARCVAALEASSLTRVAVYRAMPPPLPWWSAMHAFAKANTPLVRVLEGPVSMLRCDVADATRCSARGVTRVEMLEVMSASSPRAVHP